MSEFGIKRFSYQCTFAVNVTRGCMWLSVAVRCSRWLYLALGLGGFGVFGAFGGFGTTEDTESNREPHGATGNFTLKAALDLRNAVIVDVTLSSVDILLSLQSFYYRLSKRNKTKIQKATSDNGEFYFQCPVSQ